MHPIHIIQQRPGPTNLPCRDSPEPGNLVTYCWRSDELDEMLGNAVIVCLMTTGFPCWGRCSYGYDTFVPGYDVEGLAGSTALAPGPFLLTHPGRLCGFGWRPGPGLEPGLRTGL